MNGIKVFALNLIIKFVGLGLIILAIQYQEIIHTSWTTAMMICGLFLIFSTAIIKIISWVLKAKREARDKNYLGLVISAIAICYLLYRLIIIYIA